MRAPWLSASLDGEGQCRKIRLAARWQDVHSAVSNEVSLSPATAAFALHRLGCLFVYMSWQRRAGGPVMANVSLTCMQLLNCSSTKPLSHARARMKLKPKVLPGLCLFRYVSQQHSAWDVFTD